MVSEAGGTPSGGVRRAPFLSGRLASLLAVLPLGVWTVNHVWNNLAAFRGARAWEAEVITYSHPVAQGLEAAVVVVPLLLHTVWGVQRLWTSRPNNERYRTYANLKYLLQRLSAVGALLFLGAHMWLAWLEPRLVHGRGEPFADLSREMRHHVPTLVVYLLGTLAIAYHLANGLYGFCFGWGVVTTRAGLRRLDRAVVAFGLVLLAMSWAAIYALWAAGGGAAPAP